MSKSTAVMLHEAAVKALATYTAYCIVIGAEDNEEDPLTYSTDDEIVLLYAKDLAGDVSVMLPSMVKAFVPMAHP